MYFSFLETAYENDRLKTIGHNGMDYTFGYDSFGNLTQAQAGSRTLVTNTFKMNGTQLEKSILGNNTGISYEYDQYDRVVREKSVKSDGGAVTEYEYLYDHDGNLAGVTDKVNNEKQHYFYSISNQLARVENSTGASVQYGYDENDALKTVRATYDQVSKQMSYEYDADYNETKTTTMGGKTLTSEYDALGRVITKRLNTDNQFTVTYGYRDGANGSSSAMIQSVSNNGRSTSYLYHDDGNIRRIQTPWTTQTFEYDAIGQLIRVNDDDTGHTTVYSYDAGGNMTSEKVYSYTTAAEPATEALSQRTFTYDTAWKDQMLTCGGKALTYDGAGNLLSYDGTTFTWTKGRRLSGVTKADGTAAAYTYNHHGQRASKTVGGVKHTYFYSGNLLIREKAGSLDMRFSYDSVGNPVSILYNDVEYYYVKNLQGDVIGLIDTAGTWVVEYSYDVWGNIRSVFGSMASTLGQDNPIRYRGYYYDNETKLYYVLSRYYSPELCRFISADVLEPFVRDHENSVQYNLYVYCWNNPVNMFDGYGDWPEWVKKVVVTVAVVAVITVAVAASVGAVALALGASVKIASAVKTGALIGGATAGGVNTVMQGIVKGVDNINPAEAANSTFFGATSGAISGGIAGGYPNREMATATQLLVHGGFQVGANVIISNMAYIAQTSTSGSEIDLYGYAVANVTGIITGVLVYLAGLPAVGLAVGLQTASYGSTLISYLYNRMKKK
ncbi:RHS repeat domain-containing protein [Frisingicoccus sp.]|uniref:RHS repeat domain-containing protein n=1 Tax=Frisingicoccus sp. TaxID=1918627 RepID=UPI003AB20639